ncbi:hypothetical protein J6590_001834 [Homalodisca vitripennis]|nr:hypothetical protein J6590_001834 [Homalodisca vitripennis]
MFYNNVVLSCRCQKGIEIFETLARRNAVDRPRKRLPVIIARQPGGAGRCPGVEGMLEWGRHWGNSSHTIRRPCFAIIIGKNLMNKKQNGLITESSRDQGARLRSNWRPKLELGGSRWHPLITQPLQTDLQSSRPAFPLCHMLMVTSPPRRAKHSLDINNRCLMMAIPYNIKHIRDASDILI